MGRHNLGPFREAAVCDCGDHGFVGLTRGFVSLFDAGKLDLVAGKTWGAKMCGRSWYAWHRSDDGLFFLHRILSGAADSEIVDHKNHDALDNRDDNLRKCTHAQNLRNRRKIKRANSSFKGVSTSGSRWRANITLNSQLIYLGQFVTAEAAARAYDAAAIRLHGPFACTNASLGLLTEAAE